MKATDRFDRSRLIPVLARALKAAGYDRSVDLDGLHSEVVGDDLIVSNHAVRLCAVPLTRLRVLDMRRVRDLVQDTVAAMGGDAIAEVGERLEDGETFAVHDGEDDVLVELGGEPLCALRRELVVEDDT